MILLCEINEFMMYRWAWTMADKDKNGVITSDELVSVVSRYKVYLRAQPDILKLIDEYDSNHDHVLDSSEMHKLLQVLSFSSFKVVEGDSFWYHSRSGRCWETKISFQS